MSNPSSFRVTFHVSHPSFSASEIENVFKLPVKFSQSVGLERRTNQGVPLGGTYKRTNVNFLLHKNPLNFDHISIIDFINTKLVTIDFDYTNKIFITGGRCFFIIGIFTSDNVMLDFTIDSIQHLSSAKIGIKLDIYGGEDEASTTKEKGPDLFNSVK